MAPYSTILTQGPGYLARHSTIRWIFCATQSLALFAPNALRADVGLTFQRASDYVTAPATRPIVVDGSGVSNPASSLFVGNGQSGNVVISSAQSVVNYESPLAQNVSSGATSLTVANAAGFSSGGLVLVVQMDGLLLASGAQSIPATSGNVGRFELVRISTVSGNTLTVTTPLTNAYGSSAGNQAQVVSVPEYYALTVAAGASLVPPRAWDGASGGILALAASASVTLQGSLSASAQGFRGGASNPTASNICDQNQVDDLSSIPTAAGKGEGLGITPYGGFGRGNIANGGGGGDALGAGGGGGAGGGRGGQGGAESALVCSGIPNGGLPGVPIADPPSCVSALGGGGGAGQLGSGTSSENGGPGGGSIFVFATTLNAAGGSIYADGAPGQNSSTNSVGGGGGGAGGSVYIQLSRPLTGTLPISVDGAQGGNVMGSPSGGSGGGGGGGRVFVSTGFGPLRPTVDAGLPGAGASVAAQRGTVGQGGTAETGGYVQLASSAVQSCVDQAAETLRAGNAGQTSYLLSRDGGANWEYFNGRGWATGARVEHAMPMQKLAQNMNSFGQVSAFNVRIYLSTPASGVTSLGAATFMSCACGDGILNSAEDCDDGNTANGDGCSSTCSIEPNFTCAGNQPTHCGRVCGNGVVNIGEGCDDGNLVDGDGCDNFCQNEAGFACIGSPSHCYHTCGNGVLNNYEQCDDGNIEDGDGCTQGCVVESTWTCGGIPSHCLHLCGNGYVDGVEECDDGNLQPRDGCSPRCTKEPGWACTGVANNFQTSACYNLCGNGNIDGPAEACDDGGDVSGDGCSSSCALEPNWVCFNQPSQCAHTCGNGNANFGEQCDTGSLNGSGGCSINCQVLSGWTCTGIPSICSSPCGDGVITASKGCDDDNTANGDGCSAQCNVEPGWACTGAPSHCAKSCGNGVIEAGEACDDNNLVNGDGCNNVCRVEFAWYCGGSPSVCYTICGDGEIADVEECDNGALVTVTLGCTPDCKIENGWVCTGQPSVCDNCGDGIVEGDEQCDSGASLNGTGAGCKANCQTQPGYVCTGNPSVCAIPGSSGGTSGGATTGTPGTTGTTTGGSGTMGDPVLGDLAGGCQNCSDASSPTLAIWATIGWLWIKSRGARISRR